MATVDIPGAFLPADMDDVVHMELEGKLVELMATSTQTTAASTYRSRMAKKCCAWE